MNSVSTYWVSVDVSAGPEKLAALFGPEAVFGIVIVFVLAFRSLSESLGFHFVIGAFFGALLLDKRQFAAARYDELRRTLSSITGGFLAPVFFAYLGWSSRSKRWPTSASSRRC